jgi:GT2 family glycosyltransferase
MRLGMQYVLGHAQVGDYLLMLNDDVKIDAGYISSLVHESLHHQEAIVGSIQCCQTSGMIMGYGFSINYCAMKIIPLSGEHGTRRIDALPGRGALYPVSVVRRIGLVNTTLFPHYFGDIEYSARARDKGFLLTIGREAYVYTERISSDRHIRMKGQLARWFSFRSKENMIHRLFFFSTRGPIVLRLCAVPRFIGIAIYEAATRLLKIRDAEGDNCE